MTFSAALFVASVALWAETVRHYRRPVTRNGFFYKRPVNLTIAILLGFASVPLVTWRASRWLTCHVWRWDIQPRINEARRRVGARWARHGQTPGAVLHAAAHQTLALPAAQPVTRPAPLAPAAVEGMWVVDRETGVHRFELVNQGQA